MKIYTYWNSERNWFLMKINGNNDYSKDQQFGHQFLLKMRNLANNKSLEGYANAILYKA